MNKPQTNPSDFKCTSCGVAFPKRMSMTGQGDGQLRKGTIMVCSECAAISVLGDSNLHPMAKAEFEALPMPTKRALVITKTQIEGVIKDGGVWNPNTPN